jgi:hypothetical protein
MAGTSDEPSIDPFNDPFWLPFEQVHQLLRQQYGDPQVTAVEMAEGFAIDVPTMKRSRMYWADREILSFEYWNEHDLVWSDDHLVLVSCPPRPLYRLDVPESFVGYAWLPALAKRWLTIFASLLPAPEAPTPDPQPQAPTPNIQSTDTDAEANKSSVPVREWMISMQAKFFQIPEKSRRRSTWVRDVAFPQMEQDLKKDAPYKDWDALRRALYKKIF